MNRNYKYEFVFRGWQSFIILILAGVGLLYICENVANKLIVPLFY